MSNSPSIQHQSSLKRPHSAQNSLDERSTRSRVGSEQPPSDVQNVAPTGPSSTEDMGDMRNPIILRVYDGFRNKSADFDYQALLKAIIIVAGGQLSDDFTPDTINSLVNYVPSVKLKLKQAMEMQQFMHLPQEQAKEIPNALKGHERIVPAALNEIKAAAHAWHTPYRTQLHKLLYNNIQNMPRTTTYSNFTAIIQSSGTGKSRMVDELAKILFTIPFNLREDDVYNKQGSWPPADTNIRKHLRGGRNIEHECVIFYYEFLGRVFRNVRKSLEILKQAEEQPARIWSHKELASSWRTHLATGTNRHLLYEQIRSNDLEFGMGSGPLASSTALNIDERKKIAGKSAFQELRMLLALLPRPISSVDKPIKLLLYFDEADALQEPVISLDGDKTLYDILLHCLNYLVEPEIFTIFLSTKSDGAYFAPAKKLARSARAQAHTSTLQAPITETPFDCHPELPVDPATLSLDEISTIKFMSKFGRPLWWSMLESLVDGTQSMRQGPAERAIIELARTKLIRSQNLEESVEKLKDGALAVLDVRLMLNFEPNREISDIDFRLVASHMRTAYSIPNHRQYIRSGYPSEPILAEAAAQQMSQFRKSAPDGLSPVVSVLRSHMEGGLLDLGERGEVVARMIITEAYDRAVECEYNSSEKGGETPLLYSRGCLVTTFIEEVFPNASEILDSYPDNVPSRTKLRDAFKKSILRFTHFARMRDDSVLTPNVLLSGFIRCMAFVGHSSQKIVDIFLPVLIDEDEPLSISNITMLLIQIKRRKRAGSAAAYAIDADQLNIFRDQPGSSKNLHPYLAWIMELGVQPSSHSNTKIPTKVLSSKPSAKKAEESASSNTSKSTSAKPFKTKKHVTISSGADIIPDSSSGTPANPASGKGDHDASTNSATITPVTPSKVTVSHREKWTTRHLKALHPRYAVTIHGCSNTVYKGIDPREKDAYAALLASRDLLAEHARTDVESLNAVRTLKPFWSLGSPSFGWIKDSILNGEEVETVETVVVEKFNEEEFEEDTDEEVL